MSCFFVPYKGRASKGFWRYENTGGTYENPISGQFFELARGNTRAGLEKSTEVRWFRKAEFKSDLFLGEGRKIQQSFGGNGDPALDVLLGCLSGEGFHHTVQMVGGDVQRIGIGGGMVPSLELFVHQLFEVAYQNGTDLQAVRDELLMVAQDWFYPKG